jgi:hypothetical protein
VAQSEFERAIALDPNGPEGGYAHDDFLTMTALITGRFEDIIRQESQNLARNPLDTSKLFFWAGFCSTADTSKKRSPFSTDCSNWIQPT